MSFTTLDADLAIHQKLSDEPNDVEGLTAGELKEKFDEAGLTIQHYLNETHLPEVEEALRETLQDARSYTDRKVVAVGAGDMAAAVYDTAGRRKDVYAYAHEEAVKVLGSAARFGYVAMGPADGASRNGSESTVTLTGGADPRGMWDPAAEGFRVPQGASSFGVILVVRWGRHVFNMGTAELLVNGEPAAACSGPEISDGQYRYDTVMLTAPVRGGDLVSVRLKTQPASSGGTDSQAEIKALYLRAEILM